MPPMYYFNGPEGAFIWKWAFIRLFIVFLFSFHLFLVSSLAISSLHSCELFCHFFCFILMQKQLNCCIAVLLWLFMQYTGFVQSLEFLKKVLKFAQQFSRPGKSLEMEIKCGKMVKSLEFFFFSKLQQVLYKWSFFHFGQILFNLSCTFAAHLERSFVPAFL